jgi:hypothetical protein
MYSNLDALRRDVARRLRRGDHVVLYGPFGSGKSALLTDLETRLVSGGVPCARVAFTRSLDDITQALDRAYPFANILEAPSGADRRLRNAADLTGGVLLLDHLVDVSNAMVKFLRRLRGGILGVLTAVDTEIDRERRRMRPWRLGALAVRMPPVSAALLRELLRAQCTEHHLPLPTPDVEWQLAREARGRPGWVLKCVELQLRGSYQQGEQLFVSALSADTEIALQTAALRMTSSLEVMRPHGPEVG